MDVIDACCRMENADEANLPHLGNKLLWTSPDNRYAMAKLVERQWDFAKPHFAVWEKEAVQSPVMLAALPRRYTALGEIDKAQDCLTCYIHQSPDHWAYQALAKTQQGPRQNRALARDPRARISTTAKTSA